MYIFDVEGTLSDCEHRNHLIPDWDAYHSFFPIDKPIQKNFDLLWSCVLTGEKIAILTGMMSKNRQNLMEWLTKHGIAHHFDEGGILMRPDDCFTSSPEFKLEVIKMLGEKIHCVFDDRQSIVDHLVKNEIPAVRV